MLFRDGGGTVNRGRNKGHTHTQTQQQQQQQKHPLTHARTHTHTRTHKHTHARTHARTHTIDRSKILYIDEYKRTLLFIMNAHKQNQSGGDSVAIGI